MAWFPSGQLASHNYNVHVKSSRSSMYNNYKCTMYNIIILKHSIKYVQHIAK